MSVPRFMGLDLGGTNIKTVVLEFEAQSSRVALFSTAPTHAQRGPAAVVDRLVELGRRTVEDHGPIEAVGLGIPGLFDGAAGKGVLLPNLPGSWDGVPLRAPVADGLGLPVTLINDARAFTLAEARLGAGRGCRSLVCMTLGTGVGGGILLDGKLHLGVWDRAGEIGHQTVVPDGPRCGCGNRGCAEALAKADALVRLAGRPTPEEVYAGVREGDERCRAAVTTVGTYLGIALANVVTVFGPERIVIGGGIAAAGDLLLEPIRAEIRRRATLVPSDQIQVVPSALGSSAGSIGAALAAAEDL